jgi:hypothetical protein
VQLPLEYDHSQQGQVAEYGKQINHDTKEEYGVPSSWWNIERVQTYYIDYTHGFIFHIEQKNMCIEKKKTTASEELAITIQEKWLK